MISEGKVSMFGRFTKGLLNSIGEAAMWLKFETYYKLVRKKNVDRRHTALASSRYLYTLGSLLPRCCSTDSIPPHELVAFLFDL